ncbi:uncharacterized protein LOC109839145 [Asparagus officinalis]|uniref:uncharacterized protein LOC109839145 n=1 Tax=Asparagus officinalis TaxID=4686 RepID=UPI00098E2B0A|nr:uncharacterized protein LOC109839145 [Asparagus officinalis]
MEHSLSTLLAQNDNVGHEQAIYYLSRILQGAEHRYPMVEKECLALVFAIQKTRHYLVGQTIHVISRMNLIRVFMTQPGSLNWHVMRWALLLSQYNIYFMSQKSIKGQAICDLIAKPCTNNVTEYNALLIGLDFAKEFGAKHLEAFGDSQLIVRQMMGEYEVRNDDLIPCHQATIKLAESFDIFHIEHVLCSKNTHADALASLAANLAHAKEFGAKHLEAFGDSQLIVRQMMGEYEVRNDDLIPCHQATIKLAESFDIFHIEHVLCSKNTHADALASLAANLAQPLGTSQQVIVAS